MKFKNVILLIFSCLLLTVFNFGLSIIYAEYVYDTTDGLTSINVADFNQRVDAYGDIKTKEEDNARIAGLFARIDRWAKCNQAMIIQKNAFSAGCGYLDYSGWLLSLVDENEEIDNMSVYVTNKKTFNQVYVKEDVLFPGKTDLKITSYFENEYLPSVIKDCDFLYPLTISNLIEGVYLTDGNNIEDLLELFGEYGYEVIHVHKPFSIVSLMRVMLSDGLLSFTLLIAMITLLFCIIYCAALSFRNIKRRLQIHRIFGLSKLQILVTAIVIAILAANIASGVFCVVLFRYFSYVPINELKKLAYFITIVDVMLSVAISTFCSIKSNRLMTDWRD